jgi:hypothetical protein
MITHGLLPEEKRINPLQDDRPALLVAFLTRGTLSYTDYLELNEGEHRIAARMVKAGDIKIEGRPKDFVKKHKPLEKYPKVKVPV